MSGPGSSSTASRWRRRTRLPGFSRLAAWLAQRRLLPVLRRLDAEGADEKLIAQAEAFLAHHRGNSEVHLLLGGAYWGRRDWHASRLQVRRSLALRPRQPEAAVFLLSNYRHLGWHPRGIAFGQEWLRRHGPSALVGRHLALLHDDVGDTTEALAVAQTGLRADPRDARLASVTAYLLAKLRGAEAAMRFAAPYAAAFAGDTYCGCTLADGLAAAGAHEEAARVLSQLLGREPGNGTICGKLLAARVAQGLHADVVAEAEAWRRKQPLTAAIANEAGRAQLELSDAPAAVTWFRRAHELAPADPRYAANFGMALGLAGRTQECIAFCRDRLQQDAAADRLKLLTAVAIAHTERGEHADALPYYRQAYEEFPNDRTAQANLLVGLNWLERYQESAELAAAAGGPDSRSARFWGELAWAQHQLSEHTGEAIALRAWQTCAPDDPEMVRATLRCLNAQQREEEALSFVRGWTEAYPGDPWGWRYLADQYHRTGAPELERAAVEEAVKQAPGDPAFVDFKLIALRRAGRSAEALSWGTAWMEAHGAAAGAALCNRLGLAADDAQDWPAAERWYRRAHESEPADPAWCGNLLRALVKQGRAAEAIDQGRAWVARYRPDAYVASKLAWALRVVQRRREESDVLAAARTAHPRDETLAYDLFNSLLEQTRTAEAGALLDRLTAEGLAAGRFYNNWANHLRDLSRCAEAEAAYRRGLIGDPDNQTLAGNLSSLLVSLGRAEAAVNHCEAWLERRPSDHYVRRQLAHAQYDQGHYEQAEANYCQVLAVEPDAATLVGRRVACLRLIGRNEEALSVGEAWLANHEGDPFLLTELGIAARRRQREQAALAYFERALQRNPNWPSAAYWKLETLGVLARIDEAIAFGLAWTERHDAAADFHNELAILLDRAGETEPAERHFRRANERDPTDATLAGNAVEIVTRQGRHEEAIRLGQCALWQAPPNAYLLRRLAEAYSRNHEDHIALDLLHRADELAPEDPHVASSYLRIADEAGELTSGVAFARTWLKRARNAECGLVWSWLARLHFHHDDEAAAYEAIARARELEPDNIRHARLHFSFLLSDGHYRQLTTLFEQLPAEWRDDATLLQRTSRAYREMGISSEAQQLARHAVHLHPTNGNSVAWLASLLRDAGCTDEAQALLHRWSAAHGRDAHVALARAQLELEAEQFAAALREAETALALDPAAEDAFVVQIRALRGLGQTRRARALLHRWIEHHRATGSISRLLEEIDEDHRK